MQKKTLLNNLYKEEYRPQFHFSPPSNWMNDPNGLIHYNKKYHLFYQYYPNNIFWGPMHWGHAVSKDLIHWENKPIALYPDKYGYIFSGTCVIDYRNTSKLSKNGNPAMVAIFTYHNPKYEKEGRRDYQTQGLAYSLDEGDTWIKYPHPIIQNPGEKDFRDPNIFWYEKDNSWRVLLAVGNHIRIYKSKNLLNWKFLSSFKQGSDNPEGVWECPELIKLKVDYTQKQKWVFFISINPGAPNGGSGTQYFIGNFDGKQFVQTQDYAWIDLGTDNYAGIAFENIYSRSKEIFIGWMNNWSYGQEIPTKKWRSSMTLPRKIGMVKFKNKYYISFTPHHNIYKLLEPYYCRINLWNLERKKSVDIPIIKKEFLTSYLCFKWENSIDNVITISYLNNTEKTILTLNIKEKKMYLDRSLSGHVDFGDKFSNIIKSSIPFFYEENSIEIFLDQSSIEIFLNKIFAITVQIFPKKQYDTINIHSKKNMQIKNLQATTLKSIWNKN